MGSRIAIAVAMAMLIVMVARRARLLSRSGAGAAIVVAVACAAAGWSWAIVLIAFFVSASLLSSVGAADKLQRTADIVAKGGERDARQVIANGGIFALAALGSVLWPSTIWSLAGAGAIAASTSDTWATEIGTLRNASPVSILTGRLVPPGTSGGVTLAGFIAGFAGAGFIGLLALVLSWPPRSAAAALVSGTAGCVIDSLLGAAVQSRRWCSRCDCGTERAVHSCGTETVPIGGISWIGNDQVNLISSFGGALLGLAWA